GIGVSPATVDAEPHLPLPGDLKSKSQVAGESRVAGGAGAAGRRVELGAKMRRAASDREEPTHRSWSQVEVQVHLIPVLGQTANRGGLEPTAGLDLEFRIGPAVSQLEPHRSIEDVSQPGAIGPVVPHVDVPHDGRGGAGIHGAAEVPAAVEIQLDMALRALR